MKHDHNFGKFLLLWSGELVSAVGGGLTSFGLSVYVFRMTGRAADTALVALLAFLPTLLLSVPAGVLADRMDRRLLMVIGDGCSAIGIIYILLCMMRGGATLTEICIGVTISSVFSSLLEPAYRATITDILEPEEFTKASGIVGLAGSARYLLSPVIAGLLLAVSDIRLLLVIDICTFFLTVTTTLIVRSHLDTKTEEKTTTFFEDLKEGWGAVAGNKGILVLLIMSSLITLFMGSIQILSEPMILAFTDSKTLGITETVCASGMLVSGILLGFKGIKKRFTAVLSVALAGCGIAMVVFGLKEEVLLIGAAGFAFFFMLPFANSCLDYLIRINIPDALQGRAWGVIGFISQLGYVAAYGGFGVIADRVGKASGLGVGRGAGYTIMASGVIMAIVALTLYFIRPVRDLENGSMACPAAENAGRAIPQTERTA
ncbi:MAG: MFS transporter [Lachnospiraceae bacterium]|nr:MFS transporter [Lachnospiraceae bacterium]